MILLANLKSQANASSKPPPSAAPSIAAMTGIGKVEMSSNVFLNLDTKGETSSICILALSFKSAPKNT